MDISMLKNDSDQAPMVPTNAFTTEETEKKMEDIIKEDNTQKVKRDNIKKDKKKKSNSQRESESYIPHVVSKFNPTLTKRQLELEAYASVLAAFRAQGELTWKKETILGDLRGTLKISDERHRMELKQAEEALSQLNFPINRKSKTNADPFDSEELSSDMESNSEEEGGKRKKQKTLSDKYQLGAFAVPNSDNNQPATIIKIPMKKKQKKESKKVPKVVEGKTLEATPFENLPPEVLEAKEAGDLERLKAALQKHQEQVKAELAALNATVEIPQ